ncbi:tyrosine-type recombinase/integrase [Paraburkholderia bannensis]|uniref:tyrosine-type recombinase/integrase n=1 Tax=Paraburkholderia bannensis TaxID=765414 RepID=UPI002ABD459C|nr:tyrosine-type recombinase/integrase [Paraburkholderia bannensis]
MTRRDGSQKWKTELALWICLSTLCRIGELLIAERKHVDLEKGTWLIPRANVKGSRENRREHLVFLSDFARQKFAELLELSSYSTWLFPARNKLKGDAHVCTKSVSKQIGDRQTMFQNRSKPLSKRKNDDSLVLAGGANGNWTPHDLRRTGATMTQELGVSLDVIDRCQNHIVARLKVRRHYLLYAYATEKTLAWKMLGGASRRHTSGTVCKRAFA